MQSIITITQGDRDKIELLVRVAEEMGLTVNVSNTIDPYTIASEASLAEDWNSPEDARWDEVFAHLKK